MWVLFLRIVAVLDDLNHFTATPARADGATELGQQGSHHGNIDVIVIDHDNLHACKLLALAVCRAKT